MDLISLLREEAKKLADEAAAAKAVVRDLSAWSLPPLRTGRPADAALAERRAMMSQAVANQPVPATVSVTPGRIGGVQVITVRRTDSPSDVPAIVYLHGGGYRLGTIGGWVSFAARLADASGAEVVLVEYRLAPEFPFPAALHDAVAVYEVLLDRKGPLLVGGDSAGGGLAAAVAAAAATASRPLPAGLILISPWCDLTVRAASYDSRSGTDKMFSRDAATSGAELYCQGLDAAHPMISPRLADAAVLGAWPRTLIFAGGDEVLLDDATGLAGALASAGVAVELHVERAMQHVFPTIFPDLPESARALETMARFVRTINS